jgi:hypothetical protein
MERRALRLAFLLASLFTSVMLVRACFSGITGQHSEHTALLYGKTFLPSMFMLLGAYVVVYLGLTLRLSARRRSSKKMNTRGPSRSPTGVAVA